MPYVYQPPTKAREEQEEKARKPGKLGRIVKDLGKLGLGQRQDSRATARHSHIGSRWLNTNYRKDPYQEKAFGYDTSHDEQLLWFRMKAIPYVGGARFNPLITCIAVFLIFFFVALCSFQGSKGQEGEKDVR